MFTMTHHPTVSALFIFAILFALPASGQEEIPLAAFDRLEVNGAVEVILIPGETETMVKRGTADQLKWMHRGKTLTISAPCRSDGQPDVTLELTYRQLAGIEAGNCAWLRTQAPLKANSLKLDLNYYSQAYLEVDTDDVQVTVRDGAFLELDGRTRDYYAEVNNATLQRLIVTEGNSATRSRQTDCDGKEKHKQKQKQKTKTRPFPSTI